MDLILPVHVAELGKSTLRFFKSPLPQPDFVWHVSDDLMKRLALPRGLRRAWQTKVSMFARDRRMLATPDGIVEILTHYAAKGMIKASVVTHHLSEVFENDYALAAVEGLKAVMAGWPENARWNYFLAAAKFVHRAE